jgi:magnesium transporter
MIVDCAVYKNGIRHEGELTLDNAREAASAPDTFVWISLHEPDPQEIEAVASEFNLHPLAVEDAIVAHQRPKIDTYRDLMFVVLKPARYVDHEEVVKLGEIMMFVGTDFIITVGHGDVGDHSAVRRRIEEEPQELRRGPSGVLHAIIDKVVDGYFPVVEGVEVDIEEVEREVFSDSRTNPAQRIYKLKREVLEFYGATVPLTDPLDRLVQEENPLVHEDVHPYFRDVHDHLLRIVGRIDGFRDLLTSVLTANLTQVSVRQNDDTRTITAWVAIAAVPTVIGAIYGMNFRHMPELGWRLGYPYALTLILLVCIYLYWRFKKAGWL